MTKLVRKLKQMTKKRMHRKTVQKRKMERAQRDIERKREEEKELLERETDLEMLRISNPVADTGMYPGHGVLAAANMKQGTAPESVARVQAHPLVEKVVGGVALMKPAKKKKELTKKQMRRKERNVDRGKALVEALTNKWEAKKRRVRVRAQIRNQDLD